ncbi:hypothetical protein D9M73_119590 [compost metagenome]
MRAVKAGAVERGWRAFEGDRHRHVSALTGGQRHVITERGGGETGRIVDRGCATCDGHGKRALVEGARRRPCRGGERQQRSRDGGIAFDRGRRSDAQRAIVPRNPGNRAHPAGPTEELRRCIDLERAHREQQMQGAAGGAGVGQPPLREQAWCRAVDKQAGVELPTGPLPPHMRHRQCAVFQRLCRGDIGPAEGVPVSDDERFDRKGPLADFDRAILADQPGRAALRRADQRPIGLFAGKAARESAARCGLGEAGDERVGRSGPFGWAGLDFGERGGWRSDG